MDRGRCLSQWILAGRRGEEEEEEKEEDLWDELDIERWKLAGSLGVYSFALWPKPVRLGFVNPLLAKFASFSLSLFCLSRPCLPVCLSLCCVQFTLASAQCILIWREEKRKVTQAVTKRIFNSSLSLSYPSNRERRREEGRAVARRREKCQGLHCKMNSWSVLSLVRHFEHWVPLLFFFSR